jgi:biopolymer transport protein ExbD
MNLKPRRTEEPELNLVSLIDVVLMLVVFFMLSSTFVDESSLRIRLPEATTRDSSAPPVGDALVVTVTEAGGYRVNGRELINASADTLRGALLRVAGDDRTATVTIRADARATHQSVVTALDVVGRLGFSAIDIATVPATAAPAQP